MCELQMFSTILPLPGRNDDSNQSRAWHIPLSVKCIVSLFLYFHEYSGPEELKKCLLYKTDETKELINAAACKTRDGHFVAVT